MGSIKEITKIKRLLVEDTDEEAGGNEWEKVMVIKEEELLSQFLS